MGKSPDDTPAMRQYHRFKEQHPGCVLFFRIGDFYEMFHDDAKLAHKVLGVTLTRRSEGVPMAGVPYHAVEGYLRRMIQAGYRVAVCDQVEDAALAKGIVKRDVTRVITPGTITDDSLLDEGRENPLAALLWLAGGRVAVAWAELSTGSFALADLAEAELADELARIAPRELLYQESDEPGGGPQAGKARALAQTLSCAAAARPGWQFRNQQAREVLCRQFQVLQLAGFGLDDDDPALGPAGALVHYLLETQRPAASQAEAQAAPGLAPPGGGAVAPVATATATATSASAGRIAHLQPPKRFLRSDHLIIDQTSLRSLEIEQTLRTGGVQGSLLGVLQDCFTAMGKRALRQWLCYPLRLRAAIEERQRVVWALLEDQRFLQELGRRLDQVQDVQRISSRIAVGRAAPRDLVALGESSAQAQALAALLQDRPAVAGYFQRLELVAAPLAQLGAVIAAACAENPPPHLREGGLFRDGYDAQLDEYRLLQRDSNSYLAAYQKQLIDETGIAGLKVGFNKIFGYYIELSAGQRDKAPDYWSRKQTLKNAERFTTEPLKEFEAKVLSAEQRAYAREQELFLQLCAQAQGQLAALHQFAQVAAELDVLACFARRAQRYRYVCPQIVDEPVLHIRAGRHPVLDELLGDRFVPNDVALGPAPPAPPPATPPPPDGQSTTPVSSEPAGTLALITGPNMAGKSTYIRQTALMVLLAHTGSFVPAEAAVIGLCDRIFTRVGASDELHAGQSTFMVEMTETANICHHASPHSLVILDEIGRGTSTLDGLALAWAIAEHLALRRCRTLFATHYHEITALAGQYDNVANLNVSVREWQDQIVFLHRIVPGATDRSYGIHVAQIAGLPAAVVQRARALLAQLEVNHNAPDLGKSAAARGGGRKQQQQLSLFTEYLEHPAVTELRKLDVNQLTPLQAFDLLRALKGRAEQTSSGG